MPRQLRVLVIEDDLPTSEIVERFLTDRGHEVRRVETAEEGLDAAGRGFDVILLDNELPGQMGLTVLPRFKSLSPAKVVVMSGHSDAETQHDAILLGAQGFLPKPLDLNQLEKMLGELAG